MPDRKNRSAAASASAGPAPMGMGMGMGGGGPWRGMMMQRERSENMGPTLKRLWMYLGRQRLGLVLVSVFTALSSALSLAGPYLLGRAIDRYIVPRDFSGLFGICLLLLAVYVVGTLLAWLQSYVVAGVSQQTVRELRYDLFAQLQRLHLRFFDSKTHGELMSRTTNDIENVSNTLNQSVTQILSSILMLAGSFAIMLKLSLWLTLISLITIPLVMLVSKFIAGHTRQFFSNQQQSLGELNGFIEETISGQKVVQAFHRERKSIEEFRTINLKLRDVSTKAQIYSGTMGPVMNMINNLNFLLIAAIGGWMALRGFTTIGVMVSFLNYSRQFSMPINQLANQFNMFQSAVAGAERVFEILDTGSEFEDPAQVKPLRSVKGEVHFDNISFSYKEGVPVLKDVTLTAKPGDTIALVGPTGAGKTTIINLLTRFYELDQGAITIDGEDIRTLDKNSLRARLGIVLQDAYLFSDTIRENIRYGRLDATDEEIEAAARLANADGFIRKLAYGYDTLLKAEGSNLSQGQRQLITIARAILANPAILILDEATSSVDTRTEMHIQEAMRSLMKGRTCFVIAHRLSTIRDADQILVINGGRIVERGTHEQLLKMQGFYSDLYTSQFTRRVRPETQEEEKKLAVEGI